MHSSKLNVLAVAMQVNVDSVAAIPLERMNLLAQQYWTISRSRLLFWNQSLAYAMQVSGQSTEVTTEFQLRSEQVIEEVLLSQLHANVWGGVLGYYDQRNGLGVEDRLVGLGLSISENQRETAARACDLLRAISKNQAAAMSRIGRLQRRMERWTDRLLASVAVLIDVAPFCFELERVCDLSEVQAKTPDSPTMLMLIGGLQAAQLESGEIGFAARMNHDLACLMLSCLPLNVLSEVKLNLDTSIMRTDQATWEMDCLLERALCLDMATTGV